MLPGLISAKALPSLSLPTAALPRYTGQNKVNPMATILSGMLMLRYLKEYEAADQLEQAVTAVIAEGKNVTYDMKPDKSAGVGTSQVADAVIQKLKDYR